MSCGCFRPWRLQAVHPKQPDQPYDPLICSPVKADPVPEAGTPAREAGPADTAPSASPAAASVPVGLHELLSARTPVTQKLLPAAPAPLHPPEDATLSPWQPEQATSPLTAPLPPLQPVRRLGHSSSGIKSGKLPPLIEVTEAAGDLRGSRPRLTPLGEERPSSAFRTHKEPSRQERLQLQEKLRDMRLQRQEANQSVRQRVTNEDVIANQADRLEYVPRSSNNGGFGLRPGTATKRYSESGGGGGYSRISYNGGGMGFRPSTARPSDYGAGYYRPTTARPSDCGGGGGGGGGFFRPTTARPSDCGAGGVRSPTAGPSDCGAGTGTIYSPTSPQGFNAGSGLLRPPSARPSQSGGIVTSILPGVPLSMLPMQRISDSGGGGSGRISFNGAGAGPYGGIPRPGGDARRASEAGGSGSLRGKSRQARPPSGRGDLFNT